jgi:hypothetical protein
VPAELATRRIFPLVWCAPIIPFFSFAFGVSDLESSGAARDAFGGMMGRWRGMDSGRNSVRVL